MIKSSRPSFMKTWFARLTVVAFCLGLIFPRESCGSGVIRIKQGGTNSTQDGKTWATAYHELRDALATGIAADYWVAAGTYKPTADGDRTKSFTTPGFAVIIGGFGGTESDESQRQFTSNHFPVHQTVLSGDIGTPATNAVTAQTVLTNVTALAYDPADPGFKDNSYHVIRTSGFLILDGLIIANGNADPGTNIAAGGIDSGLIELMNIPDPKSKNSRGPGFAFRELDSRVAGGGILVTNHQTAFYNFSNKQGFPELSGAGGNVTMKNCRFINNQAMGMGGAVACYESQMVFQNTLFWLNSSGYSGGAFWGFNQISLFQGCDFYGNAAIRSGGAVQCITMPGQDSLTYPLFDTNSIAAAAAYVGQVVYGEDVQIAQHQNSNGGRSLGGLLANASGSLLSANTQFALSEKASTFALKYGYQVATGLSADTSSLIFGTSAKQLLAEATGLEAGTCGTIFLAITVVAIAGQAADALAVYMGADPNNPWLKGTAVLFTVMSEYNNPISILLELAKLLASVFSGPGPTYEQQAGGLWRANQELFNNNHEPTLFYDCQFRNNVSAGMGGALMACYDNVLIEKSLFQGNVALTMGGALAFSGMSQPILINDAIVGNRCQLGASAIVNSFQTEARIINCTIVSNTIYGAGSGAAIDNETGANVVIGNSILWGNTVSNGAAGMDVFTAKSSNLSASQLANYNSAGNGHWQWVAVCDIRNSNLQSLSRMEIGHGDFADLYGNSSSVPLFGDDTATYATGYVQDDFGYPQPSGAEQGFSFQNWEFEQVSGSPNVGEGNRETMLNPAYGNISVDPHLSPLLGSFPNSPGVGKGNPSLAFNRNVSAVSRTDLLGQPFTGKDMGATENNGSYPPGVTYYVNQLVAGGNHDGSSWANAATTIPTRYIAAGDSIWVAAGTYSGNHVLPAGVSIYGGFAGGETNVSQSNPSLHPTIVTPISATNALRTLGGGAVIHGLTFNNFTYWGSGSALAVSGPATVQYCAFINNYAPAGALNASGSGVNLYQCNFTGNGGDYGALLSSAGSLLIRNCRFDLNQGVNAGGCYLTAGGNSEIWGSEFYQNSGGGIVSSQSSLNAQNCTLYGNTVTTALKAGGITFTGGGSCSVLNTILYGNRVITQAPALEYQQINLASKSQIKNCILQGLRSFPSVNSLDVSPQLQVQFGAFPLANSLVPIQALQIASIAPSSGLGASLAINAGAANYDASAFTPTDLAGQPRLTGSAIDIGAYEYQGPVPTVISNSTLALTTECGAGLPYLVLTGSPAEPSFCPMRWQVNTGDGNGFTDLTVNANTGRVTFGTTSYTSHNGVAAGVGSVFPAQLISGFNTSQLTISNPPTAINGYLFRLWCLGGASNGAPALPEYLTPAVAVAVYNPVLYVNAAATGNNDGSSWKDAFRNLHDGIERLPGGCGQIWVAGGTYYDGPFDLRAGQFFYGGFKGTETNLAQRNWQANPTMLQTLHGSTVNLGNSAGTPGGGLDGFVLQQTMPGPALVVTEGTPTIQNCVFTSAAGGTYAALVNGGSPTFSHCQFFNWTQTALVDNAGAILQGCVFMGNRDSVNAGAITSGAGAGILAQDCVFSGNSGGLAGAVNLSTGANSSFLRCSFTGNTGTSGPGALAIGINSAVLDNCLIAANTSLQGAGAVRYGGTNLLMTHCTIANNTAFQRTAGLDSNPGAGIAIWNSIFWGNQLMGASGPATEAAQMDQFTSVIHNTIIQGLAAYAGNNNLSYAPLFENDLNGNFRLISVSPGINAGSASAPRPSNPGLDLVGNPRAYAGTLPDAGCFEFQGVTAGTLNLLSVPTATGICGSSGAEIQLSVVAPAGSSNTYQWYALSGNTPTLITNGGNFQVVQAGASNVLNLLNAEQYIGQQFQVVVNGGASLAPATVILDPPAVIYVNASVAASGNGSSWGAAFKTIQSALAIAGSCTEIWVARGTYACGTGLALQNGVSLYGGFIGSETLRTQRNPTNNLSYLVPSSVNGPMVSAVDLPNDPLVGRSLLDGFYLTGNGVSTTQPALKVSNCAPLIRNCTFGTNALGASVTQASGVLFDSCLFTYHTGTSLAIQSATNLQAMNCRFINGKGLTGVTLTNSTVQLSGCFFTSNQVANSQTILASQSTLDIADCIISGNSGFSALVAYGSTVNLNDSEVTGNTGTTNSSAIYGDFTTWNLLNDTIAYNRAGGLTGGLWVASTNGSVSLINTILWQNSTTQNNRATEQAQMFLGPTSPIMANSLIQGLNYYTDAGPGLLAYDPVFLNPAAGKFQLTSVSPAVGMGATAGVSAAAVDPLGNLRLHGGVADIGAYAFTGLATLPSYLDYSLVDESVCRFGDTSFHVFDQSGQALAITWQVNAGSGFTNVINDAFDTISTAPNGSALRLYPVPANYNSNLYRFVAAGSVNFTSPVVSLTINPQTIVYVDSQAHGANNGASWTNAFTSLATAINSSSFCNVIWVAAGTYDVTGAVLPPGVEIDGGFTNGAPLNARNPVTHPTVLTASSGLPLTQSIAEAVGQHTILDGLIFSNSLTAIRVSRDGGSPIIQNCNFLRSGLLAFQFSSPIISNTTFSGSSGYYPIQITGARVSLSQCVISNCQSGIYSSAGGYLLAANCQFVNNTNATDSGVAHLLNGASFLDCAFLGNSGLNAGAVFAEATPVTFRDCLFARNVGGHGAIWNLQPSAFVNCTIVSNTATYAGGIENSSVLPITLINSIVWGNRATGSTNPMVSQIVSDYLQPGFSLTNVILQFNTNGVIGVDPHLNANYTLPTNSAAINAGNNAFTLVGEVDLAGNPRVEGGTVDLGAYELSAYLGTNGVTYGAPPQSVSVCQDGTAFFQASGLATYSFQWQYSFGSGWTNFNAGPWLDANVVLQTNGGVSTLQLTGVGTNLNALPVRALFVGTSYITPPATLTVIPTPIIYVDASGPTNGNGSSWAQAYNKLSPALSAVFQSTACSPIIEMAQGTYTTAGTFSIPAHVVILGGFPSGGGTMATRNWPANPTILTTTANSGTVVTINSPVGSDTILDGLIIQGPGTGIHTLNSGPTLQNLIVRGATISGGIQAEFPTSGMVISNCVLSNNITGLVGHDGSLRVVNCGFYTNGGTLVNYGGALNVANTVTNGNWSFQDCVFYGNTAFLGGSAASVSYPTMFRDCLFAKNTTTHDGGVILAGSPFPTRLVNCTVASNTVTSGTGAGIQAANRGDFLTLQNSIVWGNPGPQISFTVGNPSGANNLVQNGGGGAFLNYDPLLNPNYTLSSGSPAINSGLNSAILPGEIDLAGNPRIQQSVVDLGAYESPYSGSALPVHGASPASITACPGASASFQVTGLPFYSFQWQYGFGAGWAEVTNGALIGGVPASVASVNGVSTLALNGVTTNLSGLQVQAIYTSQSYTTAVAVLTVASAPTLYVDQSAAPGGNGGSWATAYRDLGFALAQAAQGLCGSANILVAQGNYSSASNFLVSPHLAVYGGFPAGGGVRNWQAYPTVLNGSSNVIRIAAGATNDSLIDGFMVHGGGEYGVVVSNTAPRLQNLVFSGSGRSAILVANSAGGMVVSNCAFTGNLSSGNGAGINATNSIFTLLACSFTNNVAANGGAVYLGGGALSVRDSLFVANLATNQGGAILNAGGDLTLVNCTLADNSGGTHGGGYGQLAGSAVILNSILWANNVTSLGASNTAAANVYALQGGLSMTNDIVEFNSALSANNVLNFNPFFTAGYGLAANSPAINAGDNGIVFNQETDLGGHPRIQNSVVDLGAYESALSASATLYVGPPPLPVVVCPGGSATFQASGLASYDILWQYNLGGGWTNFAPGPWLYGASVELISSGGVSTLGLSSFSTNLVPLRIQAVYSGLAYTTAIATVSVPVTVLYVNASAAPGGDGRSWTSAYRDLAPALLAAAQNPCQNVDVLVAGGTYNAAVGYVLPAGVQVYGGFVPGGDFAGRDWRANPTLLVGGSNAPAVSIQGQGDLSQPLTPPIDRRQLTITLSSQLGELPFTPSWTAATDSLIGNLVPTVQMGDFGAFNTGGTASNLTVVGMPLTINRNFGAGNDGIEICGMGGGSLLVYQLPPSVNGFEITNITTYGGWQDGGRDRQDYTVSYATAADPDHFLYLTTVRSDPSDPTATGSATRVAITDATGAPIAKSVVAVMFNFLAPTAENNAVGYTAITVQGTAADSQTVPTVSISATNQTSATAFTPTWPVETDSLISGLAPTTVVGDFRKDGTGGASALTYGKVGDVTVFSGLASCGGSAGATLIYTLTNSINGSDITNVVVYTGWQDNGRFGQYYTLSYSTVAAPTTFIPITTVFYLPVTPGGGARVAARVAISPLNTTQLARNVASLKFDFGGPPQAGSFNNGWQGYAEIIVEGTNSPAPALPPSNYLVDGFILTGASSGLIASNANSIVQNCKFIGNHGLGVGLNGGRGSITNCVFQGNSGGAIYATNCELVLANALVTGNGGGLALFQGTGTLINTTVAGNEDVLPGSAFQGGIHSQGTDLTIFNSILWYNRSAQPNPGSTEAQQLALSFAGATIANSSIEGLAAFSGPGVTGQTPVFVLPLNPSQAPTTNGDYRLATCSPLIDAGNAAFASELPQDLVGNPRVSGSGIDLGPFEFSGAQAASMSVVTQPRDLVFPDPGANFFALSADGNGLTYDWQIALAGTPSSFASLAGVPGFAHANLPLLLVHQPGANFNGAQVRCQITSSEGCVVWTRAAVLTVSPTVPGTGGALLNATIVNAGVVQLTFSGIAGAGYVVQRATSLAGFPVLWTDVSTNLTDGEGLFIFQDLQATNLTTKFYRTRTP